MQRKDRAARRGMVEEIVLDGNSLASLFDHQGAADRL